MHFTVSAIIPVLERIIVTLWVGGLWVTGLVLAPVLFASFQRVFAGDIAGRLFTAMALLGMVCAVLLLILGALRCRARLWRDWRALVVVAMLSITAIGEFVLASRMRALKQVAAQHAQDSGLRSEFGILHGVSSALYLSGAVLGLVLVVAGSRPAQDGN